ncbi:MAG TPA: radical SAM protein [Polyangiaceae bacterium]|jgi:MoaA/NifB/PqqE/SkfB family radical SAM enzyme
MLSEETHAAGVADKVTSHEDAAHEKRNWVRLTFDCNDHCVFCLDSDSHNGDMRDREDVKRQILEGRRAGATRLILSGGEPTIHPNYVEFVRLGQQAGYPKIQTVTNGRMFSYGDFLERCLDAGLSEITFSIHGPNAKVHDALVGTKGAFEQEMKGLRSALEHRRASPHALPIVNVDIVVNRGNVRVLPDMLALFYGMGVKEFDLLQVVPFGRAFTDGKDTLFYDLAEMRPYIQEALAYSKKPDVHIWMNRFPPQHLEGYEHLIQDPYKLNDEVRGRKEEYARLLDEGIWLSCREPARCKYCYLQRLCDTLEGVIATVDEKQFDVVRVDATWESKQPKAFGGDPASARRSKEEAARNVAENGNGNGKRALPLFAGKAAATSLDALVEGSAATTLRVCARSVVEAAQLVARFPKLVELELELDDYAGLEGTLGGAMRGRTVVRATARTRSQAQELLGVDAAFEVTVDLTKETAAWLRSLPAIPPRVALRQPNYERLTEASANDVDLKELFADFARDVPVDNVPACILGRAPREPRRVLDTTMMTPEGQLEIFRYTRRYILEEYRTKSLRCTECVHLEGCAGMHINYVRAHGYGVMEPVREGSPQRIEKSSEAVAT